MYAPLLIFIISSVCLIPAILWCTLPYRLYEKYDEKCYYKDGNGNATHFYGGGLQEQRMIETGRGEEVKQLKKYDKKKDFWYKQWSNYELTKVVVLTVCIGLIIVFGIVCLCNPLMALDEANYWKEFAPMAQNVISNADPMQTIAIAGDIIEYNKWLADARASQETFGCWSSYYFIDLSNLQYITVN